VTFTTTRRCSGVSVTPAPYETPYLLTYLLTYLYPNTVGWAGSIVSVSWVGLTWVYKLMGWIVLGYNTPMSISAINQKEISKSLATAEKARI